MKRIGFIGAYDKTDVILSVAKVLAMASKKVLVIDDTITQKCKYVVPVINPTKSYITTFEEIDVAVGFESIDNLKQPQIYRLLVSSTFFPSHTGTYSASAALRSCIKHFVKPSSAA